MAKAISYVLLIAGLVLLLLNLGIGQKVIPVPENMQGIISGTPVLIGAIVLIIIGVFLAKKSGGRGKKGQEVPIYRGKEIIGYRRH